MQNRIYHVLVSDELVCRVDTTQNNRIFQYAYQTQKMRFTLDGWVYPSGSTFWVAFQKEINGKLFKTSYLYVPYVIEENCFEIDFPDEVVDEAGEWEYCLERRFNYTTDSAGNTVYSSLSNGIYTFIIKEGIKRSNGTQLSELDLDNMVKQLEKYVTAVDDRLVQIAQGSLKEVDDKVAQAEEYVDNSAKAAVDSITEAVETNKNTMAEYVAQAREYAEGVGAIVSETERLKDETKELRDETEDLKNETSELKEGTATLKAEMESILEEAELAKESAAESSNEAQTAANLAEVKSSVAVESANEAYNYMRKAQANAESMPISLVFDTAADFLSWYNNNGTVTVNGVDYTPADLKVGDNIYTKATDEEDLWYCWINEADTSVYWYGLPFAKLVNDSSELEKYINAAREHAENTQAYKNTAYNYYQNAYSHAQRSESFASAAAASAATAEELKAETQALREETQEIRDGIEADSLKSITQTTTSTEDSGVNVITATTNGGTVTTFEIRNGSKGEKGDTPVLGTDYFTSADKASIVTDVIAALEKYGGETEAV